MSRAYRRGPGEAAERPRSRGMAGTRLTLDVERFAHGGHGVARHQGRVVFVRHALPGERVVAVVTKGREKDRFVFADAVEVLQASPHRVEPPCPYAGPGRCGGCDLQHADLAEQRRLKAGVISEQLHRLGGVDLPVEVHPVPGDEDGLRWRTRVEFAVDDEGRAGLRRFHSHDVVPVEDCLIARPEILGTGVLERRWPAGTRSVDVVAPSASEPVAVPVPQGAGDAPVVRERLDLPAGPVEFEVNARGFWQVHPGAASTFVRHVMDALEPRPGERCLDLYAGVGVFASALADAVGPEGAVLAVESDEEAVAAGEARFADVEQLEFRAQSVADALEPLVAGGDDVDLVVLDPPRAGAGADVVRAICGMRPRAVAYVACDPAALGRDVGTARECGYDVVSVTGYDAFPMTHHVETICVWQPQRA